MGFFWSVGKERSQDNAKDVDLGHWHFHFLTITWQRAGAGRCGGGRQQFSFASVNFHMPLRYPKEDDE